MFVLCFLFVLRPKIGCGDSTVYGALDGPCPSIFDFTERNIHIPVNTRELRSLMDEWLKKRL